MNPAALFVGAHPDDIEIGCGGTVAKLCSEAWSVLVMILTDEDSPEVRARRREEAIAAAARLGVPEQNVMFVGLPDGSLGSDRNAISAVRALLERRPEKLSVAFVHAPTDQHNDHTAACNIVRAAIRNVPILGYYVRNSMALGDFEPGIYVDISAHRAKKIDALRQHLSQISLGRIDLDKIAAVEAHHGEQSGFAAAEGLQILTAAQDPEGWTTLHRIDSSSFTKFWACLAKGGDVLAVESQPRLAAARFYIREFKETEGLEALRAAFAKHYARRRLRSISADSDAADEALGKGSVILVGGSVSNRLVRDYFNHFAGLRYIIDYEMPGFDNIHLLDRQSGKLQANYRRRADGKFDLTGDIGILTIMHNPLGSGTLIGCMGIHSLATKACLLAISQPELLSNLDKMFFEDGRLLPGQVLVRIEDGSELIAIDDQTLHRLPQQTPRDRTT